MQRYCSDKKKGWQPVQHPIPPNRNANLRDGLVFTIRKPQYAFLAVLVMFSAWYWNGLAAVPFHPDESTYIFMSTDVEIFLQQPSALFWSAGKEGDPVQRYRVLDGPLLRYLIGTARLVTGTPGLPMDWDWGKTWEENQQAGAFPTSQQIQAARAAASGLVPLALLLLYLTARRLFNERVAWLAALLMAVNALILLHTRRAMAEGPLVFTLLLALWSVITAEKRPWLAAAPAALAFCAKHSLAVLAPIGLLAVFWQAPHLPARTARQVIRDLVLYVSIYIAILFLFNPLLWSQPVQAIQSAVSSRQELANLQSADRPESILNTPARKIIGMLGGLYLTPPIFAETGNYLEETAADEALYLANPLHSMGRSPVAGGILLIFNLFGFGCAIIQTARRPSANRGTILLLSATLILTVGLLLAVPLPWQRYYIALVPTTCLWTAYGLETLLQTFRGTAGHTRNRQSARPTGD